MNVSKVTSKKKATLDTKQLNYNEVVAYLDSNWNATTDKAAERMKKLDAAFDNVSQKIDTLFIAGTNGKSLTINYAQQLLQAEGLKVGAFASPHVLTYNERININQASINNKAFTEYANTVIAKADEIGVQASSYEILTMMALLYFKANNISVALAEVPELHAKGALTICTPKVVTITRVTAPHSKTKETDLPQLAKKLTNLVKKNTWVVCGDQSKSHLQLMQQETEKAGGLWAMPIRKLAVLPYPFEQLHGRCAALAERIAHIYVNECVAQDATVVSDSLLVKKKGRRGRPTIAAKQESLRNPKRTVEQFWKTITHTSAGQFQLLNKEKPTVLLDNASNLDAFENLLLGIRLLHYQRPLKGLTLIIGAAKDQLHNEEFLKLVRYFFKKTSGQLFICPIDDALPGTGESRSWDPQQVVNDIKSMKVRAQGFASFKEAFEAAKSSVDERNGLVVVTGSQSLINNYWSLVKGIKKIG